MEVGFASGSLFTIHCLECGFQNGGEITKFGYPDESSGLCVQCGGRTEWLYLQEV